MSVGSIYDDYFFQLSSVCVCEYVFEVRICVAIRVCVLGRISTLYVFNNSCAFHKENLINKSYNILGLQVVCTLLGPLPLVTRLHPGYLHCNRSGK